jgi:CHASE3 domain sensor protein
MKKLINWVYSLVNPPIEKMQIDEAKKLLSSITSRFSIEEQSDIVQKLKVELVAHRKQEIEDTEKHLLRLQTNLIEMQLVILE